jgi:Spy/CpxP family protein refolding chaperone
MRLIALLFILLSSVSSLAWAANDVRIPAGKWWQRPEVVRRLQLTPEQRRRLDAVSLENARHLIDLKAEIEKRSLDVREELDSDALDRARIQRAASALSEARARLFERELMLMVDIRGVLTTEQWNQLRTLMNRGEAQRRQMGERRALPRPPRGGRRVP